VTGTVARTVPAAVATPSDNRHASPEVVKESGRRSRFGDFGDFGDFRDFGDFGEFREFRAGFFLNFW